jgi:U3 small nucleolar ribonucleoprotein component
MCPPRGDEAAATLVQLNASDVRHLRECGIDFFGSNKGLFSQEASSSDDEDLEDLEHCRLDAPSSDRDREAEQAAAIAELEEQNMTLTSRVRELEQRLVHMPAARCPRPAR